MAPNAGRTEPLGTMITGPSTCRLVVVEGEDAGLSLDVKGQSTIGSSEACDLVLHDTTVSAEHVRVVATAGGVHVTDLDSTNGTVYLGTKIHEAVVPHGAVLTLGRTRIAVQAQAPGSARLSALHRYGALLGSSVPMRRLYAVLERLESTEYTVLILGETGVGKDLVAREIHAHSVRARKPFEVVDCSSVTAQLAESELFGHVRGAFTGAVSTHEGAFTRAHDGTVFLDEIGELSMELQPKLLRVLDGGDYRPVGGDRPMKSAARLLAATNRNLAEAVREGTIREDLFHRLNVISLEVPPLRARREDIPELVQHFVDTSEHNRFHVSSTTIELFTCAYDWPGNVRELRNAIRRVLALGTLPESLETKLDARSERSLQRSDADWSAPFSQAKKRIVDAFEVEYLSHQLKLANNNLAKAARSSGVDRSYFKRLLKRHGLLSR